MLASSLFKMYDIRGTYPSMLNEHAAYCMGYAFANTLMIKLNNKNQSHEYGVKNSSVTCPSTSPTSPTSPTIIIGYDSRLSSPSLSQAFASGVQDTGVQVINIGLCPTPMLYYAVWALDKDNETHPLRSSIKNNQKLYSVLGGAMITGSHLPKDQNGIKLVQQQAVPFFGDQIIQLKQWIAQNMNVSNSSISNHSVSNIPVLEQFHHDMVMEYVNTLIGTLPTSLSSTCGRYAWDCGNGAVGEVVETLTHTIEQITGNKQVVLFAQHDGHFPNRSPDPTQDILTQLVHTINTQHLDGGFAFDGDGDRLVVLNHEGKIISTQDLFVCFVKDMWYNKPVKQSTISSYRVVMDIRTSRLIQDWVSILGEKALKVPCGHPFIKQAMRTHDSWLGGEQSGHFYFQDYYFGYDDGLYAALRYMAFNAVLHNYPILPSYHTSKDIRFLVNDKKQILHHVRDQLKNEGILWTEPDGIYIEDKEHFILIRSSNTEDKISVTFEAKTSSEFQRLYTKIQQWIPQMPDNAI